MRKREAGGLLFHHNLAFVPGVRYWSYKEIDHRRRNETRVRRQEEAQRPGSDRAQDEERGNDRAQDEERHRRQGQHNQESSG